MALRAALRTSLSNIAECSEPVATLSTTVARTQFTTREAVILHNQLHIPKRFKRLADDVCPLLPPWRADSAGGHTSPLLPTISDTTLNLAYDAQQMYFTDGSCKSTSDAHVTGAGVFRASPRVELVVSTQATGEINTITRAELVAIHAALEHMGTRSDETIASDSATSLFKIAKHLRDPCLHHECPHRPLLDAITHLILQRANEGVRTSFRKVKSHIGIEGNEQADRLAGLAVDPAECNTACSIGTSPRTDMYWAEYNITSEQKASASVGEDRWAVSNLSKAVKTVAQPMVGRGYTNQNSIYVQLWDKAMPDVLKKTSFVFWDDPKVPLAAAINTLKYRYGQLWTMKAASRQRRPYLVNKDHFIARNTRCPLCGEPDGGTHMLMQCEPKEMKKLHISRHNSAARHILKVTLNTLQGFNFIVADVSAAAQLPNIGAHALRVPDWLLPSGHAGPALLSRPDIMIIEMTDEELQRKLEHPADVTWVGSTMNGKPRGVKIIEVGFCQDLGHQKKIDEKQQQHSQLQRALEAYGMAVTVHPLVFGAGGTQYISTDEQLKHIGIHSAGQRHKLQLKLHRDAVNTLHTIITARRRLEYDGPKPPRKRPP